MWLVSTILDLSIFSGLLLPCDHVFSPQGRNTVSAYLHYTVASQSNCDTDNHCWFTLVQVLAHVIPHAVYFIMLESHLLQPNHCNSPVVAEYTPMNMVWVTCIASGISQWWIPPFLPLQGSYICTMHYLTSGSVEPD